MRPRSRNNPHINWNNKCISTTTAPLIPTLEIPQHHLLKFTPSSLLTKDLDTTADAVADAVADVETVNTNTVGRTDCAITTDKSVIILPTVTKQTAL